MMGRISSTQTYRRVRRRRGLASLETIMTSIFALPFMVFALIFSVQATRYVWKITVHLLGWPFM